MDKSVCVVGAGYWGKNHIKTLHELGALSGVVEINQKIIDKYSKLFPDVSFYSSLEESLNTNFDGYIIATPAESHYTIAKKLISLKKNILIEKPMTLSVQESEELVYLSNKEKVNVLVGHVMLFHPAIKKIKEMIDNGNIGKLQYIYSNRLNLGKIRSQENVFWSFAPHDISIFQYLTGSAPKEIQAIGSSFLQKGIPDSTITHFKYPDSVEAHIFVSWLHPFKEHRLVIIGSEAMISFEDSAVDKPLKHHLKRFDFTNGVPEKVDGPEQLIPYSSKMPLTAEIEYFLDHLNGKRLKFSNAKQGLEVVKVLVESSRQLLK